MKYAAVLDDINSKPFRRQDVLDILLKKNPFYNTGSFNRHFSKLLNLGYIECVGRNLYITVFPDTARKFYIYKNPSTELSDIESLISVRFPLADFLLWETVQLNEFFNHQIAHNTIIVMVENILTGAVFESLKERYTSVLFIPKVEDIQRYASSGSVIVGKLIYRYPKNTKQKHGYSAEKLVVDLFAEKLIRPFVSIGDYPAALEEIFTHYRINETKLFNYANERYVATEIHTMIENETTIKLYTD